jgi:tRNA dimethylallyltransferase
MQVYKDIPILAAAPSEEDKKRAPHKLYGIYDASVRGNIMEWLNRTQQEITKAWENNQTPIITGGTGMYIEALEKGASPIPETPEDIRINVEEMLQKEGLEELYIKLQKIDPKIAEKLSENDTTRIRRALEIWYHTGKNMSYWQTVPLKQIYPPEKFIKIYVKPPRDILDIRSRIRFDLMMKQGALDEAKTLVERNLSDSLPAMRALGVQELKAFIKGKCLLNEAIEQAKLHTRQYAKRQSTWFNNRFDPDFCYKACFDEDKNFVDDIKKQL